MTGRGLDFSSLCFGTAELRTLKRDVQPWSHGGHNVEVGR